MQSSGVCEPVGHSHVHSLSTFGTCNPGQLMSHSHSQVVSFSTANLPGHDDLGQMQSHKFELNVLVGPHEDGSGAVGAHTHMQLTKSGTLFTEVHGVGSSSSSQSNSA